MAYIGKTPVIGNFVKLDAISVVNGQAAYTMQNGGVNFTSYDNVNQFLVSLNGVLQAPTDSFTVSGSTLTFASNLSTGDVIDFVLVLGNSLDIGTPSDNTISTAKLQDSSVTTAKLNDASVSLAKLTATGTKSSSTFLRGDNTFAEAGGGVDGIVSSADATAITIDSSERVGIGTNSPNAMLEVGTDVLIDSTSGFYGNRLTIGSPNPNQTSNGGYGFGFHNSGAFFWTMSDTNSYWNTTNPNGNHYIQLRSKGSACGSIVLQSSSTSYNTSSDYRLKENIVDMSDATTRLKSLNPKRFNFIAEPNKTVDGFLAHEVSSIVPEAITGEKDDVNEDGSIKPQGIDQAKLVPVLTKALQEAVDKIEQLEARITTLENA